jgi:hypothetical protein
MLVATRFISRPESGRLIARVALVEVDALVGDLLGGGHPKRGLGDLHRAFVDVEAVQVTLEDRAGAADRIVGEGALLLVHVPEVSLGREQEVAGAAGRVEDGERRGPAGHRRPVCVADEVVPLLGEAGVGMHGGPGRAQRVLDQEADHVGLGVELGRRNDVGALDLGPFLGADRREHSLLGVGVPELVGPSKRIGCAEDRVVGRCGATWRLRARQQREASAQGGECRAKREAGRRRLEESWKALGVELEGLEQGRKESLVVAAAGVRVALMSRKCASERPP